jgi:tetratricopeptide (TPR) repeat protein
MLKNIVLIGVIVLAFLSGNALISGVVFVGVLVYLFFNSRTALCMSLAARLYGTGKKAKAFRWFERAYKAGMNVSQRKTYAYYLLRDGMPERAERMYTEILGFKMKPEEKKTAQSGYAVVLLKTGRLDEAIERMEEIFPTYKTSETYANLGYMYILRGGLEKAKAFCEAAYDYNPEDKIILDNMVQLYQKLGDLEKSETYADKLAEKDPGFREGYYNIGATKLALGKKEEAAGFFEKALAIPKTFLTVTDDETIQEKLERAKA